MINTAVKKQLLDQLKQLDTEQQQQVLAFARSLAEQRPAGVPGKELLRFAGTIEPDDLEMMAQSIRDGCEKVDLNGW